MKKRLGIMLLTGVMAYSLALTGCSKETSEAVSTVQTEEGESVETTELTEESHNSSEQENITSAQSEEDVNQIAANEVAAFATEKGGYDKLPSNVHRQKPHGMHLQRYRKSW